MLAARRAPKACTTCRSQLLALFEYGFTLPNLPIARTKVRDGNGNGKRTYLTTAKKQNRIYARSFSTGRPRRTQDAGQVSDATTLNRENIHELQTKEEPEEITNFEQEVPGDMRDEAALDIMDREWADKNYEFGLEIAEELVAAEKELRTDRGTEMVVRSARDKFGEFLPAGVLTIREYAMYERLYGKPAKAIEENEEFGKDDEAQQNALFKENEQGVLEEVEYVAEVDLADAHPAGLYTGEGRDTESQFGNYRTRKSKKKKELEAKWQLKLEGEVERALAQKQDMSDEGMEEYYDEEEEPEVEGVDEDFVSGDSRRTHPNTKAARFGTYPSTIYLPQKTFVKPITELLSRTHHKHLLEASKRAFGGPGIPNSASTPMMRHLPPQKHIGLEAGQSRMSEIEADAYLACVVPQTFAAVSGVLVETRKRLGRNWLQDLLNKPEGPRILDAGAGGAGIFAWKEVIAAEWDSLKEDGLVEEDAELPSGRQSVLVSSHALRQRMSTLLENTTFLPRLPDYVHATNPEVSLDGAGGETQTRKKFDIIIAPHTLLPLVEYKRKNQVENLWSLLNPEGGILILIEKGMPRGFEAIAGARSMLLKHHIASPGESVVENLLTEHETKGQYTEKEKGMIVSPCTNHTKCPMYKIEGLSEGRKDFCHFSQRFIRPPFLQTIVGAKSRNHEDVKYSYLVVQRGVDLRPDHQIPTKDQEQENTSEREMATKAAFDGYEFPWTMPDELNSDEVDPDAPSQEQLMAEYNESHPPYSPFNLPRAILPPLKASKHVTLDLCTPSGTLERWIVTKGFSRQAYRDARKSKWGDLWALGAKTRTLREPRLGRKGLGEKGNGMGKKARGSKKGDVDKFDIIMGEEGFEGVKERRGGKIREGKRTKGGRRNQLPREIGEKDF